MQKHDRIVAERDADIDSLEAKLKRSNKDFAATIKQHNQVVAQRNAYINSLKVAKPLSSTKTSICTPLLA